MAYRIARGTYRWDSSFRSDLGKPNLDEIYTVDVPNSTVHGQHDASIKSELAFMELKQKRDLRMVSHRKQSVPDDLEDTIDEQEVRVFDYDVGGVGGTNADPKLLEKNKEVSKEVNKLNAHDDAFANVFNPNASGAGAYTGGKEREAILKKNNIKLV